MSCGHTEVYIAIQYVTANDPATKAVTPLPSEPHYHTVRLPLSVSGGICLDGAFPMHHADLQLHPAVLGMTLSEQMNAMTKTHARESSSALLHAIAGVWTSAEVDDQGVERYLQKGCGSVVAGLPFNRGKDRALSRSIASIMCIFGVV